jgi:hypothetical protein
MCVLGHVEYTVQSVLHFNHIDRMLLKSMSSYAPYNLLIFFKVFYWFETCDQQMHFDHTLKKMWCYFLLCFSSKDNKKKVHICHKCEKTYGKTSHLRAHLR